MLPFSQPEDDQLQLISSLNRHATPSSTWKIRTNQLAHHEFRTERRAAIASGNFKTRRLSYDDDVNTNFLHGDYLDDFLQDHRMIQSPDSAEEKAEQLPVCLNALSYSSASSSSSSSSSSSAGQFVAPQTKEQIAGKTKVEQNETPTAGEKMETRNGCKTGKWKVGLAWLAIASVSMVIFSLRCLGLYDEEEQFPFLLVPT